MEETITQTMESTTLSNKIITQKVIIETIQNNSSICNNTINCKISSESNENSSVGS